MTLSFDLVLATVGRDDVLGRLVDSLANQAYPALRLIVVDQNGDDRVLPYLERHADTVPFVRLTSGRGLNRARNVGLREVRADVVAFPDDDCAYPLGLLERVAARLREHPAWDGICARLVDDDGRPSNGRWRRDAGRIDRRNVWTSAVSPSIFLRRTTIARVGQFDEALGPGAATGWGSGDETDYLLRALQLGALLEYDPSLEVFHPQNRSSHDEATRREGLRYGMGMGRVLRKHGYPRTAAAYHVGRAVGGAALAAGRGRLGEARFHAAVARGRLLGWLAAGDGAR